MMEILVNRGITHNDREKELKLNNYAEKLIEELLKL